MASPALTHSVRILVVDDEPDLRTLYELTLLRAGYDVQVAANLAQARALLNAQSFHVLITDMRLPDGLGLELIHELRDQHRTERSVVITAYGSAENAVDSLKAGAFDYLTKPVNLPQFRQVIAAASQEAQRGPTVSATNARPDPAGALDAGALALQRMVGTSVAMGQVKERISKVARSMAPVLLSGESGTGKELAALALHANSHRAGGAFVAVNCGAIPENLLETEFFGVRKGAYTGASHDRDGYFQAARGGTLFLDEIGELPLAMQSKLLRVIQERCVRAVGGTQEEPIDVRIVSATHKSLDAEVQAGRFRQDLFYRLNVIEIHLPALREHREDLPALCDALLGRIAKEAGVIAPMLSASTSAFLATHPFKGNVRELENLLHRGLALHEAGDLELASSPTTPSATTIANAPHASMQSPDTVTSTPATIPQDLQHHLDQQERDILIQALKDTAFNRTAAAARLGISLRQIRYRIERLNIQMPHDSENDA